MTERLLCLKKNHLVVFALSMLIPSESTIGLEVLWMFLGQKDITKMGKKMVFGHIGTQRDRRDLEANFKDGVENGVTTCWYQNGQQLSEKHHKDGVEDGVTTYWNPNGRNSSEAHYKEGILMGPHTNWHQNGQIKNKEHYKDGKRERSSC